VLVSFIECHHHLPYLTLQKVDFGLARFCSLLVHEYTLRFSFRKKTPHLNARDKYRKICRDKVFIFKRVLFLRVWKGWLMVSYLTYKIKIQDLQSFSISKKENILFTSSTLNENQCILSFTWPTVNVSVIYSKSNQSLGDSHLLIPQCLQHRLSVLELTYKLATS
jgi:hypothetical protein